MFEWLNELTFAGLVVTCSASAVEFCVDNKKEKLLHQSGKKMQQVPLSFMSTLLNKSNNFMLFGAPLPLCVDLKWASVLDDQFGADIRLSLYAHTPCLLLRQL